VLTLQSYIDALTLYFSASTTLEESEKFNGLLRVSYRVLSFLEPSLWVAVGRGDSSRPYPIGRQEDRFIEYGASLNFIFRDQYSFKAGYSTREETEFTSDTLTFGLEGRF